MIREWFDKNQDGLCDAGDDSREVDVKVVTPWTAVGTWTAGQAAMVTANADGPPCAVGVRYHRGASPTPGNWAIWPDHCAGNKSNVMPLIDLLTSRVRAQIVGATEGQIENNLFQNVYFGQGPNPPGYDLSDLNGERISELFSSDSPGSLSPKPCYKCNGMIEVIYAFGLMEGAGLSRPAIRQAGNQRVPNPERLLH